jgi:cystathionine beta-lyase
MSDMRALDLSELQTHRSEKWRTFPKDVLPLPVAEMDFPVADPCLLYTSPSPRD